MRPPCGGAHQPAAGVQSKQLLQPRVLDVSFSLDGVARMLARLLAESIDLKIEIENNLARVKVDQGQLEQALLNLALNARDAMPDGGTLTIQAKSINSMKPRIGATLPYNRRLRNARGHRYRNRYGYRNSGPHI